MGTLGSVGIDQSHFGGATQAGRKTSRTTELAIIDSQSVRLGKKGGQKLALTGTRR